MAAIARSPVPVATSRILGDLKDFESIFMAFLRQSYHVKREKMIEKSHTARLLNQTSIQQLLFFLHSDSQADFPLFYKNPKIGLF